MKRKFFILSVALTILFPGYGESWQSIAFLGDSNLWTAGTDLSDATSWATLLKETLSPEEARNFSRSGATWTNTERTRPDTESYSEVLDDQNVVYNQAVSLMTSDFHPDMIVIGAGTNDVWFSRRRPGIWGVTAAEALERDFPKDPSETTSLAMSVKMVTQMLRYKYPDAFILVVTPPMSNRFSEGELRKASEIIEAVAAGSGASQVVRLDKNLDDWTTRADTKDGVHTTPSGAVKICRAIALSLRRQ